MFILPAIGVTALGVERHLLLVSYYGLQASHVAVGMIALAVAAVMFWNRIWVATRLAGLHTPGEAIGRYYNSIALRVIMMGLCILFALPYSANLLSQAALLVHQATDGTIPREMAVWVFALSMAVPAIIGGWRAVVMVLAMEALMMAILIPGIMIFGEIVLSGDIFPTRPMPVKDGILWDQIPGVLQGYAGVGKNVPTGGIFTTVAISSTAISLAGIILSPPTLYLGQTARKGPAFGISAVWLTGGLAAGILLLVVPVLAARMPAGLVAHAEALAAVVPLAGVSVILLGVMGALCHHFLCHRWCSVGLPRTDTHIYVSESDRPRSATWRAHKPWGRLLSARSDGGLHALCLGRLRECGSALALQLLPAMVGFAFMRWISRGAVLAGIALGSLLVVFTEPLGLIFFEGLFIDLPWGRWPLTIHSAGWGLAINLLIVFLSSVATLSGPEMYQRSRFHRAMKVHPPATAARSGLLWGLAILWGFLAYGPGAILGNFFFSDPIFTDLKSIMGVPSLWVWQMLFWLFGVVLVWWVSYSVGYGHTYELNSKPIRLGMPQSIRSPDWISSGLSRIVNRVVTLLQITPIRYLRGYCCQI